MVENFIVCIGGLRSWMYSCLFYMSGFSGFDYGIFILIKEHE
ncbi:unnamed protein product [marine sediment metagenome]|uniref:Uncharacterized protein n=1 Tax=marine sediment metagenome TaxID=412755 RepID=X0RMM8_9ZZZZ